MRVGKFPRGRLCPAVFNGTKPPTEITEKGQHCVRQLAGPGERTLLEKD